MTATAAAMNLVSGEPPINFAAHQVRAGNIAGARDDFEQMLAMLLAAIYPGARAITANPGDWGIDILLGELSGLVVIWQSKYFWPVVGRSSQGQIRESFDAALAAAARNGYRLSQWVLCVPASMDPPTAQWWDNWRARRQRDSGVAIELWHENILRGHLVRPDCAHVRRHFYDPYAPAPAQRAPVRDLPGEDAAALDTALFVRQLRAAGHTEVGAAKREYFNAELLAREVLDKRLPAEVLALAEDLTPYMRAEPYTAASSGGRTLIALAWQLALFEVAWESRSSHPGFLLLDSPQKNLGVAGDLADSVTIERVYRHLERWLAGRGVGAQIVVADNAPPAAAADDVVVRFSRRPDQPPYGLIDDETS